jgi:hypothetical protein
LDLELTPSVKVKSLCNSVGNGPYNCETRELTRSQHRPRSRVGYYGVSRARRIAIGPRTLAYFRVSAEADDIGIGAPPQFSKPRLHGRLAARLVYRLMQLVDDRWGGAAVRRACQANTKVPNCKTLDGFWLRSDLEVSCRARAEEAWVVAKKVSRQQAVLFTYMLDHEKRKLAFDAWEKEFGESIADPQDGVNYYEELLNYVRLSDNPDIVREFEERFSQLLPKIKEQVSIQVLNGLEEELFKEKQSTETEN